jgi:hypothetical protein
MTSTIRRNTTTTNTGESIDLPTNCPPWCTTDHVEVCSDREGEMTPQEIYSHEGWLEHNGHLDEIRDSVHGDVVRPGGGRWELGIEHRPVHDFPAFLDGRLNGRTLITLGLTDFFDAGNHALMSMTTGEFRLFIAHAQAAVDKADELGNSGSWVRA